MKTFTKGEIYTSSSGIQITCIKTDSETDFFEGVIIKDYFPQQVGKIQESVKKFFTNIKEI